MRLFLSKIARVVPAVLASVLLMYGFYASSIAPHEMHYVHHRFVPVDSLPYAYFQILRLVVCGAACFGAVSLKQHQGWLCTMVIIAILFNPVVPIRLDRVTWQAIDLAAGITFLVSILPFWKIGHAHEHSPSRQIQR
jgi:hypothetical protein